MNAHASMTSATSGAQPSTATAPSASRDTSLSGRNGENTRSTQCSQLTAASSDPLCRAASGTSNETTVPITGSACRTRAVKAALLLREGSLLKEDAAAGDLDLLGGQRVGRGPGHHVAGLDAVLAAVAGAVDGAVADLVDDAAHVRADRAERLELVRRRLGDDDLLSGEDHPAADRDLARGGERARRRAPGRGAALRAAGGCARVARGGGATGGAAAAGGDRARETHQADASQHAPSSGQRVRLWFLCHDCSCSHVAADADGEAPAAFV